MVRQASASATPRRSKRQRQEPPSAEKSTAKRAAVKSAEKPASSSPASVKSVEKAAASVPVPTSAEMLDRETLVQAATALLAHTASGAGEDAMSDGDGESLELDEEFVYMAITLKTAPKRAALKPRTVPLVHPIFEAGDDDVCLFVKDAREGEVRGIVAGEKVNAVSKVLGVTKLEKRYGTYEGKRELLGMFDLFLVDDSVAKLMPRLLGSAFVKNKKMPLVVRMDRNIPNGIALALKSTAFAPGKGTTVSVRIAKASFSAEQIADNVGKAMDCISVASIGHWAAFQTISIRTAKTPCLPVFLSIPEAADFELTKADRDAKKDADRRKRKEKAVKEAKDVQRQARKQAKAEKLLVRKQKYQELRKAQAKGKKANPADSEVEDSDEDSDGVEEAIMASFAAGEADFEMSDDMGESDSDEDGSGEDGDAGGSDDVESCDEDEGEESDDEPEPEPEPEPPKKSASRSKRKEMSNRPLMKAAKDAKVKKRKLDNLESQPAVAAKSVKAKGGSRKKAKVAT